MCIDQQYLLTRKTKIRFHFRLKIYQDLNLKYYN